jgi:hypothetical protein
MACWPGTAAPSDDGPGHTHPTPPASCPCRWWWNPPTLPAIAHKSRTGAQNQRTGCWRFVAAPQLVPVPDAAKPHLKGAHGTLVVDSGAGRRVLGPGTCRLIAFSQKLTKSEVVQGDPFSAAATCGADLWRRPGQVPLIVAADNVGDTCTSRTPLSAGGVPGQPRGRPVRGRERLCADRRSHEGGDYVTDGYGKAYLMPASTDPFKYQGEFWAARGLPNPARYYARSRR